MQVGAYLITPDGYALDGYNNSITTNWFDKRSSQTVALSFVLRGANSPTGSVLVEGSNSPEKSGGTYGYPNNTDDKVTLTGTTQSVTVVGAHQWDLETACRWVRIVYTSSSDVSGLTVSAYATAPLNS
jgi:hypothetical protein